MTSDQQQTYDELEERFVPTPTQVAIDTMVQSRTEFYQLSLYIVDHTKKSREQSLALTALEEAKFWTNQALARYAGKPDE